MGSKWRSEQMVDIKDRASGAMVTCGFDEAISWILEHCALVRNRLLTV
jgi:hypothetical protein